MEYADSQGSESVELKGFTKMLDEKIVLLKQMESIDSEAALKKIKYRKVNQIRKWSAIFQRVAAILFLPLLFFILAQNMIGEQNVQPVVYNELTTPPTLRSTFTLPDGTKVWMNGNSLLKYPAAFSADERRLEISGEVYFEVAEDKQKPFRVEAGELLIEATGTAFNVVAYQGDKQQEVLLTEGSVDLYLKKENDAPMLTSLKPNELARFDLKNRKMNVVSVDPEKYVAWKDGKIIFKNDQLGDMIQKLERWYNVSFEYDQSLRKSYSFTGTFEGEDLRQILYCIELTTPITFEPMIPEKDNNDNYKRMLIKINTVDR
ncbi:FecR family protein [Roseimarinus sediminis]|uniref:FecR family protein n=1 Tax=Roseimarinus sediminis TaxID=1610899 RepID=UPI003D1FAC47